MLYLRISITIFFLLFIHATTVNAYKSPPYKLFITMRNGQPCFYYPQQKSYSFSSLYISKSSPDSGGGWAIQIKTADRKGLIDPNRPETCVKYGVLIPETEVVSHANPIQFDTPYRASLNANTTTGVSDEIRYASDFCVTHNTKGETILVGADWDDKRHAMKCLKPGESPKRGFWQKLFGK